MTQRDAQKPPARPGTTAAYDTAAVAAYEAFNSKDTAPETLHQACRSLIYEYLLVHCLSDTAEVFAAEARVGNAPAQPPRDAGAAALETLAVRKQVTARITDGDVPGAVKLLETHCQPLVALIRATLAACSFGQRDEGQAESAAAPSADTPLASAGMLDMWFALQCQHFVELIRQGAPSALELAQDELGAFGYLDPRYMEVLQDVVSLFAYPDPAASPVAAYLDTARRQDVAARVNASILEFARSSGKTSGPVAPRGLQTLVRQAAAVRQLIHDDLVRDKTADSLGAFFMPWSFSAFISAVPPLDPAAPSDSGSSGNAGGLPQRANAGQLIALGSAEASNRG